MGRITYTRTSTFALARQNSRSTCVLGVHFPQKRYRLAIPYPLQGLAQVDDRNAVEGQSIHSKRTKEIIIEAYQQDLQTSSYQCLLLLGMLSGALHYWRVTHQTPM